MKVITQEGAVSSQFVSSLLSVNLILFLVSLLVFFAATSVLCSDWRCLKGICENARDNGWDVYSCHFRLPFLSVK